VSAERERIPVVPLEAGAGPENPPCPACGEPLFGWIDKRPGLRGPVRRCESCGLGVLGDAGGAADALAELDRLHREEGMARIDNRGAISASLGNAGWAGLEPGARYLFTVEAVRRLVANRDQVVVATRWSPGRGIALMWQTILNGLTFGRNVALGPRPLDRSPSRTALATPSRRRDHHPRRPSRPTHRHPYRAGGSGHEAWLGPLPALRAALSSRASG
jgi:hypothetical protein